MILQVLITDGLPLVVCIDCCELLNQSSDFFEKTNQAQESLRQLLVDAKSEPQPIEANIDYVEETEFPKNDERISDRKDMVDCQLPGNYINDTVSILSGSYFMEGCDKSENPETREMQDSQQDSSKQKRCKIQAKKSSPKQARRRLKRKNQLQKAEAESEVRVSSEMDEEQNDAAVKSNVTIVDNYIPGKRCRIRAKGRYNVFSASI